MLQVIYWGLHQLEMGNLCRYKNCTYFLLSAENKKSEDIEVESENLSCLYCSEAFPCALCVFCLFSSVQGKEVEEVTTLS